LRIPAVITLLAALLAVIAVPAAAQMKTSADVVDVAPATAALSAAPGARIDFDVKVDIARKWHLYAHGDSNFIGVDLVPDEDFPLAEFAAVYPDGHEGEFFGEKVVMLEGKNVIKASAQVPADLPKGEHALILSVVVQACDDKTCLAPAYMPVNIKLTVK